MTLARCSPILAAPRTPTCRCAGSKLPPPLSSKVNNLAADDNERPALLTISSGSSKERQFLMPKCAKALEQRLYLYRDGRVELAREIDHLRKLLGLPNIIADEDYWETLYGPG